MIRLREPIIDFHAHFPAGFRSRERHPRVKAYDRERSERMFKEWDFPDRAEPSARTDVEEITAYADRWLAELDRYGIAEILFLTGGGNDTLGRVIARHPDRFIGFAHHDPCEEGAVEELQRAVAELGLKGLKAFGPRMRLPFEDPALRPLWTYMAEHRLPLLIHFGWLGRAGGIVYHPRLDPASIYPMAVEFADIPIIIPHFGCGYIKELLQLCWACPNIYVDTSGSNQWMRWMPYEVTLESAFRKFYETIGPDRIIFGTDSSWFPRGFSYRYLQDQIRACHYLRFPEDDIAAIFGGNARAILDGIR